jgi:hypothetical protein
MNMQAANGNLPLLKKWPIVLSAKELEGLQRWEVFRTQESGARPAPAAATAA